MSVSKTIKTQKFPAGAVVEAYKALDQPGGTSAFGQILRGTPADTKTVGNDSTLAFTTLTANVPYLLSRKAVDAVQTLTVDATAGNLRLRYGNDSTGDFAFNVAAATLQSALQALPGIGSGNVTVSGGPGASGGGTPYVITFASALAGKPVTTLEVLPAIGTGLSGGAATATLVNTTPGVSKGVAVVEILAPTS